MMNFTKVLAETVYYTKLNRTFVRNTTTVQGVDIQICDLSKPFTVFQQELIQSYITKFWIAEVSSAFVLIASTILLTVHLYEFLTMKTTRLLNQKALACYALALFISNAGFLLNEIFLDTGMHNYCSVSYFLEYYGCMATLFWSSSMAFEIVCNVWEVKNDSSTREPANVEVTRFNMYSSFSWIGAGLIAVASYVNESWVSSCSYRYDVDGLHSIVWPLLVSISMNSSFYICSLYVVCTQPQVGAKLAKLRGIDLNLHTYITIFGTLMWITLILDDKFTFVSMLIPLWASFKVTNCLLSLIIFLHSPVQNAWAMKLSKYVNKYSVLSILEK